MTIYFLIFVLIVLGAILASGPIPDIKFPEISKLKIPNLVRKKTVLTFDQQIGFLYSVKARVLSGNTLTSGIRESLNDLDLIDLELLSGTPSSASNMSTTLRTIGRNYKFPTLTQLAIVHEVSAQTGAPASAAINRIIHSLVRQRNNRELVEAEMASTKATVTVLAALPILGFVLATILGVNPISWLTESAMGRACFIFGLLLEGLGIFWISRLIKNLQVSKP